MAYYTKYQGDDEDLETEDLGTNCEGCNVYLGEEDLVICKKCQAKEEALEKEA